MAQNLGKLVALLTLVILGAGGIWLYQHQYAASREIRRLEAEKAALEQIVHRLSTEKRVAKILVKDQKSVNGVLQTTLLFVEYAKDQSTLPARWFTIEGNQVHIEAMVIKFDQDFVKQGDGLRGHSIALFTRIYGEHQSPASAFPIDSPGKVPEIYRGTDPTVAEFEQGLWRDFWRLYEDEAYRAKMGVRVAFGQEVWGMFKPGRLYTITVEANGGLVLQNQPLEGIYREALKDR